MQVDVWPDPDALDDALVRDLADGEVRARRDLSWADLRPPLDPLLERLAVREACARAAEGTRWAAIAGTRGVVSAVARAIRGGGSDDGFAAAAAEWFARLVEPRAPAVLAGARRVVVRPRVDWSPGDVELVIDLARRLHVTVELPWLPGALEPVLAAFEACGLESLELALADLREREPLLGWLGREGMAPPASSRLRLLAAPSPEVERRTIAARVRDLVDDGTPPERIAVAAGGPAWRGELARVGLLVDETHGPRLAAAPPVRLALALYGLPARGWPREEVLAVLTSCYVAGTADGGRTARAARRAGRRALPDLLPAVARLPEVGTPAQHAAGLAAALDALGVGARARAPAAGLEREVARDRQAMDVLDDLLARLPEAARATGGERELSRDGFAALLADLCQEIELPPVRIRGGAVRLVELHELAGRELDHVFLPGLVGDEDGFLRAHALSVARESVTLSWPATVGDRAAAPARLVDELLRVAPWLPRLELRRSPVPWFRDARAPGDRLARAALETWADPAGRLPGPGEKAAAAAQLDDLRAAIPARVARVEALAAVERARWRFFAGEAEPGAHCGSVGPLPGLAARAGGQAGAPVAARHLDLLANCPFTFLAARVLGTEPPEEGSDAPSAKNLGSLAHRCLETFYRERAQAGRVPLAADEDDRRALEDACARAFASEGAPGHPVLWQLTRERVVADLWRMVENEVRAGAPGGGVPAYFELSFGPGKTLPALVLGDLHIGGRVDRVDVLPDGAGVVVIDYKLGGKDSVRAKLRPGALGVTQLQLPIYAAAVRAGLQRLGRLREDASARAAYISLRHGVATRTVELDAPGLAARVGELASRIREGRFEVRPEDCRGCAYRTVCRVVAPTEEAA